MEEELDFAGHPILGAAAVLHERQGTDEPQTWVFALNTRTVTVVSTRREDVYRSTMNQGRPEIGLTLKDEDARVFEDALKLSPEDKAVGYPLQVISTGLPYLIVPVASA